MPRLRGPMPSTSQTMSFIDNEASVDEMSIDVEDEVPSSQTQTQRSRRQTQQEPITYYEREIVDKVVERINRNHFSLKSFKISQIFKPEDKIKTRRQFFLIPYIVEKIKELNGIDLINNDRSFILSFPKELRESLKVNDPEKFTMITAIPDEVQLFNNLALFTVLAIIYFHQGKIKEGLLKKYVEQTLDDPYKFLDGNNYDVLMNCFYDSMWLEKHKYTENIRDEENVYVHWGLRAKIEINKKDLFPLFCEIGAVTDVAQLPHWLVEAINQDKDYS